MNQDQSPFEVIYPAHTPPTPPEGMRWEYRGMGWSNEGKVTQYYLVTGAGRCDTNHLNSHPLGRSDLHYFEAVPISETNQYDPKGHAGSLKTPLHLVPSHPIHEAAWVFKHGSKKYGPWNFREHRVCASTYYAAMRRHLDQWFDGLEDQDAETSRSHLAHVIASACIVMDAEKHGSLVDDRPRQQLKES